jgi:chemotaxis protein CheC
MSEIVNIGMGLAASQLNQLISSKVSLQAPTVEILSQEDLMKMLGAFANKDILSVNMGLSGDVAGRANLLFMPEGASKLVSLLTHQPLDSPDLDSLKMEVLNEVGNILINSVVGSLANVCHIRLNYSMPRYKEGTLDDILSSEEKFGKVVIVHTAFSIMEHLIEGKMLLMFHLETMENLIRSLENS